MPHWLSVLVLGCMYCDDCHLFSCHKSVCFPGGTTKWTDLNHGACYVGVILTAISDPSGFTKSGWRAVTMSLESVDRDPGGSPCSGCTTDFGVKPWDRDLREDCRVEEVLDKVTYLWLGHKNNFGISFVVHSPLRIHLLWCGLV